MPERGLEFDKSLAGALILNSGYEPVRIVSWKKAIVLWFQEKVDVLEFHNEKVHSPADSFALPSVIRLKQYIRPYFTLKVRLSRQNIFIRDRHSCQYCGLVVAEKKLTIDHVIPLSRGGQHSWSNVVAACSPCNNKKGSMLLEHTNMKLRKPPKRPRWLPHKEFNLKDDKLPMSWRSYLRLCAS